MKLYSNPDGAVSNGHARIYLRDGGGVFKMTLHGEVVDLILAAATLVDGPRGLAAVIVDDATRWGRYARRITRNEPMAFRKTKGQT